ncbi:hypothetical protein [Pseudonocardia acidicola]|uniref:Uncharacterized protein n=1 Tax=Pseudonocardia acidicola TaxID=2724939 RepID=A0ABX1SEA3_9PSEU|nr:hypothetical protein [Pseudonocardia acidicola]NMH98599.1 hypothetical protein [Pseudonocardia acidicola]
MTVQPDGTLQAGDLRDARYGEIFLIKPEGGRLRGAIYNTTGLNDCPAGKWRSLDPQKIAKEFDVPAVYLNGPRFWTMDRLTAYEFGEVRSFDGLEARLVADVLLPPGTNLAGRDPGRFYNDVVVERKTEWLFSGGRPVYELVTPDGKTYVLQAYSHIVDDSLTWDSLPTLADRLNLPEGWQYRVRTLDRDLPMRPEAGEAHVLQDELENTYMLLVTA